MFETPGSGGGGRGWSQGLFKDDIQVLKLIFNSKGYHRPYPQKDGS